MAKFGSTFFTILTWRLMGRRSLNDDKKKLVEEFLIKFSVEVFINSINIKKEKNWTKGSFNLEKLSKNCFFRKKFF